MTLPTYPVDRRPWVPVLSHEGELEVLSLRDVLSQAHRLRDIAVPTPPAASAILRLLYLLTARVTRLDQHTVPGDDRDWQSRRFALARASAFPADTGFDTEAVDEYFDRYEDRWDLYSPVRPWMQDIRLVTEARKIGVNRFDPTRPRDNSPVWFRHTHKGHAPAIPTAQAIQWLLVTHLYGPGGGGGTRTVSRQRADGTGHVVSDQYMSSGPLRAALTYYPLGRSLFETLVIGLPDPGAAPEPGTDVALWEREGPPDPLAPPPPVTSPAGLLLGRSRHAVLLHPDPSGDTVVDARITWAFKEPHPPILGRDPYTIRERTKQGEWKDRRADATRALWRDLDALLADSEDHTRPDTVTGIHTLPPEVRDHVRVRAHGVHQDRKSVDRQWITSTTPPLFIWLEEHDPDYAHGAAVLRSAAETVAGVLRSALRQEYRSLSIANSRPDDKDVPWVAAALTWYWPRAEERFWELFHARDFVEPYRAFTALAEDAVAEATDHLAHQAAVARAQAQVIRYLRNHAAKKEPRNDKEPQ
ncbi:CRISPR system Cascade subunit CasA [Actinokineospora baliensis]|uniref:type I-E CRISPR-associated protein Cse1/CasA n=1 Tax=Actinokineospora baliensis TaxID=547056 RepID=UPI0019561222|nr:type I-E CRISPR-associated protein Cse1/CasA [Actinokineospora baliensis]MBM7774099.1 CRISPR system Cascade subunit CasA [Actinokineospora baliensis]